MKLLCTNGVKAVAVDVVRQSGLAVEADYASTQLLMEKIKGGERGDLAVLSAEAIDALIGEGVLAQESRVDLCKSTIGVAVRQGAPVPDIATVEALKRALLAACKVAYSRTGISGQYMPRLFERLGITAEIAPKAVIPTAGSVGEAVARGEADLGLQQVSELMPVLGLAMAGPLPDAVQLVTVFSAGLFASAGAEASARVLVERFTGEAARSLYTAKGLEPAL